MKTKNPIRLRPHHLLLLLPKRARLPAIIFLGTCSLASSSGADQLVVNLPQLNAPFDSSPSLTFTGDGFLTVWGSGSYYPGFSIDNAHSYLQVNISTLSSKRIQIATLTFYIAGVLDTNVILTSFASTGTLGSYVFPPNIISARTITIDGGNYPAGGSIGKLNAIDITDMLRERVSASASFLGLHFIGSTTSLWNANPDDTHLRLNVVYTNAAPPNPGRFTNLSYSPETGFSFIFRDGTVGQPYRIQTSISLAECSWVDWQSFNYTGPVGFIDSGAIGTTNRFYRVVSP